MEDKKTILKLYDFFMDEIYQSVPTNQNELNEIVEIEDKLLEGLTEEQKQLVEKIREYESNRTEEVNKCVFVNAFSMATKLFVEGIKEGKK